MQKNRAGFTLIESLIYIALFAIVIGGGMIATYQIIESSAALTNHSVLQEEANFLFRKVSWVVTGATSMSNSSSSLTVTKSINGIPTSFTFNYASPNLKLQGITLNSSSISIPNLTFQKTSLGNGIVVNFTLTTVQNGRNISQDFSYTKYIH